MKELTPHPQADILRAIADGKTVQVRNLHTDECWFIPQYATEYVDDMNYELRIKPETITINGHEVPVPVREPLKEGQEFYIADVTQLRDPVLFYWDHKSNGMQGWLKRGMIHLTKEAAIAHADAMLSFTRSDK